jgi:hypothetical protein
MNIRVICRDWEGKALDRLAVGAGKRVIYVSQTPEQEPVGFPKEDVFRFQSELANRRLSEPEWSKLTPLEWPYESR